MTSTISTRNNCTFLILFSIFGSLQAKNNANAHELYGEGIVGYENHDDFYQEEGISNNAFILRRLKLGWKFNPTSKWRSEIEAKYSYINDGELEAGDIILSYHPSKHHKIAIGNMNLPFGLERHLSFRNISTVERALETDAFTEGRNPGILFQYQNRKGITELGAFQLNHEQSELDTLAARSSYCLGICKAKGLHLGGSLRYSDLHGERFQIKQRPELKTADTILRSARFDAKSTHLAAAELLGFWNYTTVSAEYFWQSVEQDNGQQWRYWGAYAQISLSLNGDTYRYKLGEIKRPKLHRKRGSWEGVIRMGKLDLRNDQLGSQDQHWLMGLNAYFPNRVRFSINYLYHNAGGNIKGVYDHGSALSSRLQIAF